MYCKTIEEACREALGEIQFEKMVENKMGGGQSRYTIELLGGVQISKGFVENPLRVFKGTVFERVVLQPIILIRADS
jgi:hypothetical protein